MHVHGRVHALRTCACARCDRRRRRVGLDVRMHHSAIHQEAVGALGRRNVARPCACMTRMEGEKWRARSGRTAWGTGSGVRHTRGRVHWVCGRAAGAGRRGGATTRIWIEIKRRRGGGVMSPARGAGGGRCGGGRGCVHGWGLCAHSVLVPSGSCQNNLILHALMPCELWLRRKVRREDCG